MYSVDYLLANSNLPGPRGNLELLYAFSKSADDETIAICLGYIEDDTKNSPEEFAGMCGIVGFAVKNAYDQRTVVDFIKPYASHSSWRIREAVAMAIQEIAEDRIDTILGLLSSMIEGNPYEKRAVVAGLCEPKLLKDRGADLKIFKVMLAITEGLDHGDKLTDAEESLRKALGYGWSVIVAASPEDGKEYFEKIFGLRGKHIVWILRENLKKKRLATMDVTWVDTCAKRLLVV